MSESIGHYDILGLVGTGTHGTVFRARDTKVGRTVAIRVLGGAMPDPLRRSRSVDLIQPYTALSHPHVATLFEVGEHQGAIYLVHEFVPGDTIASLTSGRPINVRRAIDLATQVADALAEAHSLDLIHGALGPTTVVVTPKGHAKVLDFGLTAWTREDDPGLTAERFAAAGATLGPRAVGCIAPEQLLGQAVDHRADLFALGALLHEMLTGESPFAAGTAAESGVKVLQTNPAAPSAVNPDVPAGLDVIVTRALAKKPDERYQSAATIAADLRTMASTYHGPEGASQAGLVRAPARRSPWRSAVLGSLLLAAIALAAWQWQEPLWQAWRGAFGSQPIPIVVVMPFQIEGSDLSRPYFGAAFSDDLARRMGHVPGLTVVGRSTIRAYAGKSPESVARDVGASLAVAGRLTPADEDWSALRAEVTLVDRESGKTIWARPYTSEARDVIALQAQIARDVANWLRIAGAPTAGQGRAALRLVDPAAYNLYLQARDAMADHDASRAAQLYESAIAADPSLLEAHTGLVEALSRNAAFDGRIARVDVQARIREAAEAASTTDPDLASTQLAMGLAAPTARQALERLRKAIDIDRSYTAAYLAIADIIREADPARAISVTRQALRFDPVHPLVRYQLAVANLMLGQFNDALVETARGQALAPSLPWWDALRVRIALARPGRGDAPAAAGAAETPRAATDFPPFSILRAASLNAEGRRADALALLAGVTRLYPGSCEAKAMAAAIRFQGSERGAALRSAREILAAAEASGRQMAWARCAALAAAAINDAPQAATWIARAASSDDGIRWWGAVNGVLTANAGIRQNVFPWSNVAGSREVGLAMARIDAALAVVRADAAKLLAGL